MKSQFYYLNCFLISTILFISSCSKEWLDKKTDKNITVPSTLQDYQALLDNEGVLSRNTPALGEIGSDIWYIPDMTWQGSVPSSARNAYSWSHTQPYVNVSEWNSAYERVFYCNVVLEGLQKIKPKNDAEQSTWNNIKGQ